MNIEVPAPIERYLAAEAAKDSEALGQCFREDAVVRDEGRVHRGVAAIEAWHREANATNGYAVEPLETASASGRPVVVRARVTGDFPGSPAELRFHFTLSGDRILSLEVTP
jgi:ketosteroid isomerase-like protein